MNEFEIESTRTSHHFRERRAAVVLLKPGGSRLKSTSWRGGMSNEIEFEVRKVLISWTRDEADAPWSVQVRAEGAQIKKDGTPGLKEAYLAWYSEDYTSQPDSDILVSAAPSWILKLYVEHIPEAIVNDKILADPATMLAIAEG